MRRLGCAGLLLILAALAADPAWPKAVLDEAEALRVGQAAIGRQLADHALLDTARQPVRLAGFRGKPLVVSLVYTSCSSVCPTIVQTLDAAVGAAQKALGADSFAVVTIGFDVRHDTPARMRAFARAQGIDRPNWWFLSGDAGTVDALTERDRLCRLSFPAGLRPSGPDHGGRPGGPDLPTDLRRRVRGAGAGRAAQGSSVRPAERLDQHRGPDQPRAPVLHRSTTRGPAAIASTTRPSSAWRSGSSRWPAWPGSRSASGVGPGGVGSAREPLASQPMTRVRMALRFAFERLERLLGLAFPPAWNPLYHLGALGFFFYWIVAVSGIYVYLFFDTGVAAAYGSVEYLTHQQWYAGGVMRSLHRYASDAMVVVMVVHLFREFSLDRYRGPRWFTWVTGVPILLLVIASGITGYWLVWDKLAQYVAVVTTEWLDELPIFGQSIARNFLAPDALDDRFFTLWCSCTSCCRSCCCWCCGSICNGSAGRRSTRRAGWRSACSSPCWRCRSSSRHSARGPPISAPCRRWSASTGSISASTRCSSAGPARRPGGWRARSP